MGTQSYSKFTNIYFLKYGFLAFPLSFLGIPLYMNIPKFYNDYYGISLAKIGLILFAFRVLDAFIDPILGFVSDKFYLTQKKYFTIFAIGLIIFFNGFFHIPQYFSKEEILLCFAVCTICVYLFFSLIFINYYNLGLRLLDEEKLRVKKVFSRLKTRLHFSGYTSYSVMLPFIFPKNFSLYNTLEPSS
jgi:GPH family glycoside/pentoside/hexuronide:cation symporter